MQEVATFGREVTLVQEPGILEEGAKLSSEQAYLARLALSQVKILALLPIAKIALTETEQQAARTYQLAHLILGPAAAAPMLCSKKCPDPFRIVCLWPRSAKNRSASDVPLNSSTLRNDSLRG